MLLLIACTKFSNFNIKVYKTAILFLQCIYFTPKCGVLPNRKKTEGVMQIHTS